MIISVASGKGGTGKTTLSVNLALSLENVQILDCDVEEPNVDIFLKPVIEKRREVSIPIPEVNFDLCNFCGKCAQVCNYNAICVIPPKEGVGGKVLIFDYLCHGCGACSYFCPQKAIKEKKKIIAYIEIGRRKNLRFIGGKLLPSQVLSPLVIDEVKKQMDKDKKITIIDASPGTSCPVMRAISGSDFCLLVTEPTPFGFNDLQLAHQLTKLLNIPAGVIINRSDLGNQEELRKFCVENELPILLEIPFKREIAQAYSEGIPIVEVIPEYKKIFREVYQEIVKIKNERDSSN